MMQLMPSELPIKEKVLETMEMLQYLAFMQQKYLIR